MAGIGGLVNKQEIVDDFYNTVVSPEANRSRWHLWNQPTFDYKYIAGWGVWDVYTYVGPYTVIADVLVDQSVGMGVPPTTELSTEVITASNIVNVLRNYAVSASRVRYAIAGIYYNTSGGASGTLGYQTNYAHLNDNYLRSDPNSVAGPVIGETIVATQLNNFYSSLRSAANTDTYGDSLDLRICHTSCHASCHSSRGRR